MVQTGLKLAVLDPKYLFFGEKLHYDFPKMRGGAGQRPFGIFPKSHPFWYRHPSLRKYYMDLLGFRASVMKDYLTTAPFSPEHLNSCFNISDGMYAISKTNLIWYEIVKRPFHGIYFFTQEKGFVLRLTLYRNNLFCILSRIYSDSSPYKGQKQNVFQSTLKVLCNYFF